MGKPQTAELITAKLWREFVSPKPDAAEIKRLAGVFRDNHYDIAALLRALLTTDAFYAPQNRASLVKSPVVFIVGTLRQFNIHPAELRPLLFAARTLGQDVFAPPNVKGWPGGDAWINSNTLLIRKQLLEKLFGDSPTIPAASTQMATAIAEDEQTVANPNQPRFAERWQRLGQAFKNRGIRIDADRWLEQFAASRENQRARVTQLLLATTPVEQPKAATNTEFVRQLVLDPAYQVQ